MTNQNTTRKTLYFEGAGCAPRADVPNCRIRTAFHLDNGTAVYLEISGMETTRSTAPIYQGFTNYGVIDHCFCIAGTWDDGTSRHKTERSGFAFEYCMDEILRFVNSLGASFDSVEVLPDLAGYRVHADKGGYNYGDEFCPDWELITARQTVDQFIRQRELDRGEKYPCYSLWVDPDESAALHYKNFRTREQFDIYPGIPSDLDKLPGLDKATAIPGCFYGWCDGWQQLYRVYRISEEYAEENDLMYLDRCETSSGDFALPGSDVYRRRSPRPDSAVVPF